MPSKYRELPKKLRGLCYRLRTIMSDATQQYEDALRRAFVDHHADYIVVTSRRERFQLEAASYGEDKGWLSFHSDGRDEQSTAYIYRLTQFGRRYFGLE